MDEIVKTIRQNLVKDLIYIIGGSTLIMSLFYSFDRLPADDTSLAYVLYAVGISYVIGYVVQETFGLLGLVSTRIPYVPGRLGKAAAKRLGGIAKNSWSVGDWTWDGMRILIDEKASQETKDRLERITSLRQIGTTIGPCFLLSSIPLFTHQLSNRTFVFSAFDTVISTLALIWGFMLSLFGSVKGGQQSKYMMTICEYLKMPPPPMNTQAASLEPHSEPDKRTL